MTKIINEYNSYSYPDQEALIGKTRQRAFGFQEEEESSMATEVDSLRRGIYKNIEEAGKIYGELHRRASDDADLLTGRMMEVGDQFDEENIEVDQDTDPLWTRLYLESMARRLEEFVKSRS